MLGFCYTKRYVLRRNQPKYGHPLQRFTTVRFAYKKDPADHQASGVASCMSLTRTRVASQAPRTCTTGTTTTTPCIRNCVAFGTRGSWCRRIAGRSDCGNLREPYPYRFDALALARGAAQLAAAALLGPTDVLHVRLIAESVVAAKGNGLHSQTLANRTKGRDAVADMVKTYNPQNPPTIVKDGSYQSLTVS